MRKKYQNKLFTTADQILLICLALLLPLLYFNLWTQNLHASAVKVWSSTHGFQTFSLNNNQEIVVEGTKGKSLLKIQDGKIRFIESKCTSKFCVHMGWLSYAGAFAACLPNQVSLEVIGTAKYDSINF